jgi:signal transduction histidine kinase
MKRLIPDTIAGRTLLVLLIGLALSHAISITMYVSDRSNTLVSIDGRHIGERIATIDRLVRRLPPPTGQRVTEIADDAVFKVTLTGQSAINGKFDADERIEELRNSLASHLDRDVNREIRLRYMGMMVLKTDDNEIKNVETVMASMSLPNENWLNFTIPLQSPKPFWSFRFGLSMLVMLSAVVVFSAIVVHQLTRPLAQFARASQRLGTDIKAPPLPERGPVEIRLATQAFNQMQSRIRRFIEDRTQMIAAISHDLGTPIARMRLRAEFVNDAEQQQKMLADLDDMEKMVFSALSFARDDSTREPVAKVDFRTLLHRVCDDIGDAGFKVSLNLDSGAIPYNCRPVALRRALNNLVENAAKYGQVAEVSLIERTGAIVVRIDDNGPGIPEDLREDVFKPFFRLETSRNRETGGTGLGMTVARTIIRAHGGDIKLTNREEGGLRMEVSLPTL